MAVLLKNAIHSFSHFVVNWPFDQSVKTTNNTVINFCCVKNPFRKTLTMNSKITLHEI